MVSERLTWRTAKSIWCGRPAAARAT